ncbi:MAG: RNA-binding protein [Burkholderiaceae bacterium]
MATKIYVGNLPWRITEDQLGEIFAEHGEVTDTKIVSDRETGRSRGFGFVTMTDQDLARQAIEALNGHVIEGRNLVVNEAHDQGGKGATGGGNRGLFGQRPRSS